MLSLLLATAVNTHATVRLAAPEAFYNGAANEVVIAVQPQPHWHIYWENPGDSGEEPRAIWTTSNDVTVGSLVYPIPMRLEAGPFTNFGFSAEDGPVLLRAPVQIATAAHHVDLSLALTYLVCKESCVPEKANLNVTVPVRPLGPAQIETPTNKSPTDSVSKFSGDFEFHANRYPKQDGVGSRSRPHRAFFSLHGNSSYASSPRVKVDPIFFERPEGWENVDDLQFFPLTPATLMASDPGSPTSDISASGKTFFDVAMDPAISKENFPLKVVGLLVSSKRAKAEWVEYAPQRTFDFLALLKSLGLAFLGGLILNLMPCVFPVVSLKALSFVREGAGEPKEIRRHAYAYSSGILASLWLLVALLLTVRAAGTAVGWGFQLQNPVFLFVLLGVFFVLGLNLLGVFEINYAGPARLQNLMMKRGLAGSFFTGLLTTVVATPCSAPFMGVAIGSALAGSRGEAFAVFTALAMGLAAPYLVLAFFPRWIQKLPRPGAWMETLKEFLAFPLLLTAVWLFWVLSQIVDVGALIPVLAWCVAAGFFAWTLSKAKQGRAGPAAIFFCVLAGAILAAVSVATILALQAGEGGDIQNAGRNESKATSNVLADGSNLSAWQPYSEARLKAELAAGRSVFVDFTASWCVTCQVNKRLVLGTASGTDLFAAHGVVKLRADWTRRDSEITNALTALGRNSVPVYAFYRSGAAKPKLLPEILTLDLLKDALEEK